MLSLGRFGDFLGMSEYWFEVVKENVPKDSKLVLVANKLDLERQVERETGEKLANFHKCLFVETSALTQQGVLEVNSA